MSRCAPASSSIVSPVIARLIGSSSISIGPAMSSGPAAIAIGVAAMVATQSLARSLKVGLEDAVNPLAKMADLLVTKGQAGVPLELSQRIRNMRVPGLKEASPFVMTRLSLADLENRSTWLFGIELPRAAELAKLLEDEEVEDTAGADFVVVVAGYPVPVQAGQGLGEGNDKGDWQRV